MKAPVRIDQVVIRGSVPAPDECYRSRMNQLIRSMPRKNLQVEKKKASSAIALTILLLLVTLTALALGFGVKEIHRARHHHTDTSGRNCTLLCTEEGDVPR